MVAMALISSNANINARKLETGRTTFLLAVHNGNEALVDMLIGNEAIDINERDGYGCTALMLAADCGHYDIMCNLIKHNASVNMKDYYGRNSMILGARKGHENIVKILFRYNSDLDFKDKSGFNAIYYLKSRLGDKIFLSLNFELRRNFLLFLSGCDRIAYNDKKIADDKIRGEDNNLYFSEESEESVAIPTAPKSVIRCFDDHYWTRSMLEYLSVSSSST